MPDITLPTSWTTSDTPSGEEVSKNLYHLNATPASLEVINGHLDKDNLTAGGQITDVHLQTGSQTLGRMVGATANLDYFDEVFTGAQSQGHESGDQESADSWLQIPGAGMRVYLPYQPKFLLVTWQIMWTHDSGTKTNHRNAVIKLFHNGGVGTALSGSPYTLDHQRRVAPDHLSYVEIVDPDVYPTQTAQNYFRYSAARQRIWSGHQLIESPAKGFHDLELRLYSDAEQVRVRARGFRVIAFR